MKGIVFVLHGRRDRIAKSNFEAVAQLAPVLKKANLPYRIGLLEGEHQTLETALTELVEAGVDDFTLVPLLLFAATHVNQDLPKRTREILGETSEVAVTVLAPLGTTEAIYQELKTRLATGLAAHPESSGILLPHGTSHYPEPDAELQQIVSRMSQELQRQIVGVNYIGANGYQDFLTAHQTESFVIQPFFLTHGHLVEKISHWIAKNHPAAVMLPTLEDSPVLVQALTERLVTAGCIPS